MSLQELLKLIQDSPSSVQFNDVISVIDNEYSFTPTAFTNGETENEAGQNNGSCKVFAFGQMNKLTVDQTLSCFGDYYRKDVLENANGDDHQNIRNFIKTGWEGIKFSGTALAAK
ncbi:MAG: HopJ type III effector protein [Pseudomonadales bacterium]|nr:HopJ type III effector protein [Pseudomonadales bacterium]